MHPGRFILLVLLPLVASQTITTTDVAGNTIVEVVTIDPVAETPTTSILTTLLPTPATTTFTTTLPAGQTVVEVVGVDADGNTQTNTIQTIQAGPNAATTTTVVDAAGETVVEVIQNGATQTIQTLAPGSGPGPVGQPPQGNPVNPGQPTPFTYTTTNAAGNTIQVVATFTPSVATTIAPSATFKATVLNYSQYLASYATKIQTQAANANSRNSASSLSCSTWMAGVMTGLLGVMWTA
ncbi:Protein kinase domain-containing protein [Mycena indigotica]|uniref:Protein kinase domain-containing protein n=1 Tax=Mycena indigotica TaxID=2126181 RepID=A0A8H6WHX0_9AGAR|nr:Protein kinase domain-containing protein [Mycena indigotica]KAF7315528.1 Protein kinase domain-containing protein [Mycena indigotica]